MGLYGWDIAPLEAEGNWKFQTLTKTSSLHENVVEEIKRGRTVIIDSFSEILLTRKVAEVVSLISEMSLENKDGDKFHLLLLTEGMQDQRAETAMQHFAEGVIIFNTTWTSDVTHRDILIKKMKGAFIPSRKLPYSITKKGFVIETATRIT